ncbi:MAG: sulfatase-like hydrolase/transferase [Kiritimatiellales bacterium]|nr:sulfatase-like hydrolase/transferase [Kiritimatiellales bacterium]
MSRTIKTFQLWFFLFISAAVLTIAVAGVNSSGKTPLHYVIALLLQWPLLLLIALPHSLLNLLFARLRPRTSRAAVGVTAALATFAFITPYAASIISQAELGTFISWDAFKVAFTDFRQVLPDVLRGYGIKLLLIVLFSIGTGVVFTRLCSNDWTRSEAGSKRRQRSGKTGSTRTFVMVLVGLSLLTAVCIPYTFATGNEISEKIFPPTSVSVSLLRGILRNPCKEVSEPVDIPLERQVTMEEYLAGAQPAATPNVFIIMLEAISSDHLGFTGYFRQDITPNIDRIARESLFFPNSYVAANHSNYSQTSFHSSQYARRRPRLDRFEEINYPKVLLFDILPHVGYQTAFFSAQNEDWQGMSRFLLTHSTIEHFFHSKTELGDHIGSEVKLDDALVRQRAQEYISGRNPGKPIFLYMNLQKTHFPYELQEEAEKPYLPWETDHFDFQYFHYDRRYQDNVRNKYDNALHYVDKQVGAFIDWLKANNLYDNSLIVIAADHGEAFYEKGYAAHGTSLFEDQICTFTLFKLPNSAKKEVRGDAMGLIDINPSVLEALGMPSHPAFQGKPVLAGPREGFIYMTSQGLIKADGVIDYPWKYIDSSKEGKRLINIEADPTEQEDFSKKHPAKRRELETALNNYIHNQMQYYMEASQNERDRFYAPQY